MAWSLSGSTITQSGTDTDLSGLAGIAGVTVQDTGVNKYYTIGTLVLSITGNLTISPEVECLVSTGGYQKLIVQSGATLTINGVIPHVEEPTYSTRPWYISAAPLRGGEASNNLRVNSGGTLIWNGGELVGRALQYFLANSILRFTQARLNYLGAQNQVRQYADNIIVDGFTFVQGGSWTQMVVPAAGSQINGLDFRHAQGIGASGSQTRGVFFEWRDYDSIDAKADLSLYGGVWNRAINAEKGSSIIVIGYIVGTNNLNYGVVEICKEVKITLSADDVSTAGTKVWIVDSDDGFRLNWTLAYGTLNYTDDRLYLASTTATSGNVSESEIINVLLASVVRQTGGAQGTNDEGLNKKSYRGKNGDITDVFEVRYCGYGTQLKQTDLVLKGNGVLNATDKLFTDLSISEQNPAAVAAYTEIDTAARLYDRAKLHLLDNYAGQTETLITRSGNAIDLRTLNLVIDATAAAAFAFDGTTITIKASAFTGSLTTTGTVTQQNGATVAGSIVDANGVLFAVSGLDPQSLGTTWTLGYITEADYQNRDVNAAPATWAGWNQIDGTGDTAQVQLAADTAYRLFHRAPGYDSTAEASVDTGVTFSTVLAPIADRDLQGNLLWPQTAAHLVQAAKFSYDAVDGIVDYENQTGATEYITFLAAYRAFGGIVLSPALTFFLRFLPRLSPTRDGFLLEAEALLTLRMSDGSDASAILEADLAYTNGQKAYDRFVANANHPFLLYPQMSSVLSSSSVQQVASAVDASTVLAKEATVETRASQTSVDDIPTNPLLATDVRLDNLDAKITTRPTLAQIEATTVLAKADKVAEIKTAADAIKVETDKLPALKTVADAVKAQTDKLVFTGDNLHTVAKLVEDKVGYALTSADKEAIATAVEQAILDDQDGSAILEAIVGAIGNQNIDQISLVAAIRADIERAGGMLDAVPTLVEIEASTVLAKEATVATRASQVSVDAIPTNPLLADAYTAPDRETRESW